MSCELTTYTTNVTDCCYLQILCNGTVIREFNLAELRIVDKGDSFTIRDRVGSMDFSNATIDVTAEDVRTLRCSCAGGGQPATDCCALDAKSLSLDGEKAFNGVYDVLDPTNNSWYAYWSVDPGQQTFITYMNSNGIDCFYITAIFGNGYLVVYRVNKTSPTTITITYINETVIN